MNPNLYTSLCMLAILAMCLFGTVWHINHHRLYAAFICVTTGILALWLGSLLTH